MSHSKLHVVIPTAGECKLLPRTLASLAECELPASFGRAIVVENGTQGTVQQTVQAAPAQLNAQYIHVARANKSNALNEVFEQFDDDDLIFLTDDDVRFSPNLLTEYAPAAAAHKKDKHTHVFGGPLRIDSTGEPPAAWRPFLPGSMTGWEPKESEFNPKRNYFLGANWGVYAGDIRRAGGFDPRYGPGSPLNATGQEWTMQMQLRSLGSEFVYLSQAMVWHHVDYGRYQEDFLLKRKYRGGIEQGIRWADRMSTNPRLRDRIRHPMLLARVRLFTQTIAAQCAKFLGDETALLRHQMEAEHAKGVLFSYPQEARGTRR